MVAESLSNRATTYTMFGRYAEAEALYQQALDLYGRAVGPSDAALVPVLDGYAELLRTIGKSDKAKEMESWASSIRVSH